MRYIHTSIRINGNKKSEEDLYKFIVSQGGVKTALKYLFNEYKVNSRVDDIIDRLKDEVSFTSPTVIKQKEVTQQVTPKEDYSDLVNQFF